MQSGAAAATSAGLAVAKVERQNAEPAAAAARARPSSPSRMRHALVGNRRHDDRRGDGMAEHRRLGRRRLDPAEHALAEMPRSEGGDVRAQRALGSGASGEELAPVRIHPRESARFDVRQCQPWFHRTSLQASGDGSARSDPGRASRAATPARAPAPSPPRHGSSTIRTAGSVRIGSDHSRQRLHGECDADAEDHERADRRQRADQPALERDPAEDASREHGDEADAR